MSDLFYAATLLKIDRVPLQRVCEEVSQLQPVGLTTPLTGRYDVIAFVRGEMGGTLSQAIKIDIPKIRGVSDSETLVFMGDYNPLNSITLSLPQMSESRTYAMILIRVFAGKLISVGTVVENISRVLFVGPTAGNYDLLALTDAEGSKGLGETVFAIQNIGDIKTTETCVLLDNITLHNWAKPIGRHNPAKDS